MLKKVNEYFKSFYHYRNLLKELVSRDIKLKYRRSYLGYIWSVLSPLGIMIVMSIVFSTMFNRNIENFPVYLLSGNLLFSFMRESSMHAIFSITSSAALLKKTYVPKYIFTLSKVTSDLVNLFFSLGALIIVVLVTGVGFTWNFLLIIIPLILLYVFCVGLGLFLAALAVFFRDIQYIWNVVCTAWMYLTPIFYPIDLLPEQLQWAVTRLNPMYYFIDMFRDFTWAGTGTPGINVIRGSIVALVMVIIGTWTFMKSKDRFILYI